MPFLLSRKTRLRFQAQAISKARSAQSRVATSRRGKERKIDGALTRRTGAAPTVLYLNNSCSGRDAPQFSRRASRHELLDRATRLDSFLSLPRNRDPCTLQPVHPPPPHSLSASKTAHANLAILVLPAGGFSHGFLTRLRLLGKLEAAGGSRLGIPNAQSVVRRRNFLLANPTPIFGQFLFLIVIYITTSTSTVHKPQQSALHTTTSARRQRGQAPRRKARTVKDKSPARLSRQVETLS